MAKKSKPPASSLCRLAPSARPPQPAKGARTTQSHRISFLVNCGSPGRAESRHPARNCDPGPSELRLKEPPPPATDCSFPSRRFAGYGLPCGKSRPARYDSPTKRKIPGRVVLGGRPVRGLQYGAVESRPPVFRLSRSGFCADRSRARREHTGVCDCLGRQGGTKGARENQKRRRKHSIVFSIKQQMVMGPTPPGTGVMTEAFSATAA